MSNHTQTATAHPYLSPEWLYDTLMGQIEPDLMLGNIPGLAKKYAGETAEHKKMREKQYELALMLYDDCLSELDWVLTEDARSLKEDISAVVREAEAEGRRTDIANATRKLGNSDVDA